jgi:hypothetical protein
MTKKNFNALALQGFEMDDMEYVKQFNLAPSLAYTPKLNDAMLERVYTENVNSFIKLGNKENAAKMKAGRLRANAKKEIAELLK